jgi:hypothetical protein
MSLFHHHRFDAAKWEKISELAVIYTPVDLRSGRFSMNDTLPRGDEIVYRNTCLDCGDLIFRRVRTMSDE